MQNRPNPDQLVKQFNREKATGKLKIYLGMASGVGKTFAMLNDALEDKGRGIDVVVGYIEPHGRRETENIADSFEAVPLRHIEYRGITLKDFDLDAALKRHPELLLVDELAHTNAPAARHIKRWQDIEELLVAGINVHTTVNIQHIESLKDVVSKITGVAVQETVPDSFLAKASDIELVDIPPEELQQRLREGKIYKLDKVPDALKNFFTEGNLIALRELVLRHAVERVDEQLHKFRTENSVHVLWPTTSTILVCVGPNHMAERLIRIGKQLATRHHARLITVCVEGPRSSHVTEDNRELLASALLLAKQLGAETITSSAEDMVSEVLRVAQEKNASLIIVGKAIRSRWKDYFYRSFADEVMRQSNGHDIYVVTGGRNEQTKVPSLPPARWSPTDLTYTLLTTAAVTGLCALMYPYFELSNLIMVYLLQVAWVATRFGRYEAIAASTVSVIAFDFFFVPPRMTFAVSDGQYLLTFLVMLIMGMLISSLTLRVRNQAQIVADRERRTSALYNLTKKLSAASQIAQVQEAAIIDLRSAVQSDVAVTLLTEDGSFAKGELGIGQFEVDANEKAVVRWTIDNRQQAGAGTDTLPGSKGFYFPIVSSSGCLGAIGVLNGKLDISQKTLIEAFAGQIALALDRIRIDEIARKSHIDVENEKLRNSLLSSISHDLRTPLASITGAASILMENSSLSSSEGKDLARNIHEEATRLSEIARNVLDMTKLEFGSGKVERDWNSLQELVGSALSRCEKLLGSRSVMLAFPKELPFVRVDGILVDQLFVNLLENAARYTSATAKISISGFVQEDNVVITVSDDGPGFKNGDETRIFNKLYRVPGSNGVGFGLGLAICKAIIEAHGGTISAMNNSGGGAVFKLNFPMESSQPEVPDEE